MGIKIEGNDQKKDNWSVEILDPSSGELRSLNTPGSLKGAGSEVIVLSNPVNALTFDTQSKDLVAVIASGGAIDSMVISGFGPYHGQVVVPGDATFLIIKCDGQWSLTTQ